MCSLSFARVKRSTLTRALLPLLLSWHAESHAALAPQTNTPMTGTVVLEAQQIRLVIVHAMDSLDARRWQALSDLCTDTVFVDYTSLFGGKPRNYTVADLIDNWRQLLSLFSMTRHDLGPIAVEIDAEEGKARSPVQIHHFLHGAAGGEEWVVSGEYKITLKKLYGRWRIQKIVFDLQSQEGNTNLLEEAFASANG